MLGMALATPPAAWSTTLQVLFAAGALGAIVSLATLGRSFAVFPALRTIVASGPYRLVRHPAYLCELLMVVATMLTTSELWKPLIALPLALLMVVVRIRIEERFLRDSPDYSAYTERVRWRLAPGIW